MRINVERFFIKNSIYSKYFHYLCTDIVLNSNKSTGQKPSCRGGNSLNYTLLGNLNPVHLLCKSDKEKTYPKGNFQQTTLYLKMTPV